MKRIERDGLTLYQFEHLASCPGLAHAIFTRLGGVSTGVYDSLNVGSTVGDHPGRVMENRHRIAAVMGVRDEETRTTWQVHGAEVAAADAREPQDWPPPKADAIVTGEKEIPLVMRYADCVPIILHDPQKHVLSLVHAGWRGTVARVGGAAVRAMVSRYGCRAEDILAGIGPSIGPCHYEVGPEVVEQVRSVFGPDGGLIQPPLDEASNLRLDLWQANITALRDAGIEQIEVAEICTACSTHEFFSHRAEHGATGRFGTMALMRDGAPR